MKKLTAILILLSVLLTGCRTDKKHQGLLHRIPTPPKAYEVLQDSPELLNICVPDVSLEEFDAYQSACISAGYTENADDAPISYYGESKDGYRLEITVSKSILYITLKSPGK